jgi:hypothetical protein
VFDHKNFALLGLFPGITSHRSIANLGHFEVEISIQPVYPSGGGYVYEPIGRTSVDKYKIKIRITRKGKTWEYEKIVGFATASVIAKLVKIEIQEPTFEITTNIKTEEPTVTAVVRNKI